MVSEPEATKQATADPDTGSAADRWSTALFLILCVLAVPFYFWAARAQWFFQDEFVLLTRPARSVSDLLQPHNAHLMVPERILYRINGDLFGLRRYEPYQFWSIAAHVALAAMIWQVLRRVRVNPWLAAVIGAVFLTFGSGHENITWAFQVGFGGSVTTGFAQLLLADHDGRNRRRDVLGLVVGLMAVAGSAPGLVMVGVVGLAMLLRRGWRAAAWHAGIPMALYLAWRMAHGSEDSSSSPWPAVRFMGRALLHLVNRVSPHPAIGVVLLGLVVAGAVVLFRKGRAVDVLRTYALPLSLAVGAVVFLALTAYGRAELQVETTDFADRGRYSHVLLAMLLPLAGVCLQQLFERWPRMLVPVLVVLVSGIPANLAAVEVKSDRVATPAVIAALAQSPTLEHLHPNERLLAQRTGANRLRAGWLLDAHRAGEIPSVEPDEETLEILADVLPFEVEPTDAAPSSCRPWDDEAPVTVSTGDSLELRGQVKVSGSRGETELPTIGLRGGWPYRLTPIGDDIELVVTPTPGATVQLC